MGQLAAGLDDDGSAQAASASVGFVTRRLARDNSAVRIPIGDSMRMFNGAVRSRSKRPYAPGPWSHRVQLTSSILIGVAALLWSVLQFNVNQQSARNRRLALTLEGLAQADLYLHDVETWGPTVWVGTEAEREIAARMDLVADNLKLGGGLERVTCDVGVFEQTPLVVSGSAVCRFVGEWISVQQSMQFHIKSKEGRHRSLAIQLDEKFSEAVLSFEDESNAGFPVHISRETMPLWKGELGRLKFLEGTRLRLETAGIARSARFVLNAEITRLLNEYPEMGLVYHDIVIRLAEKRSDYLPKMAKGPTEGG